MAEKQRAFALNETDTLACRDEGPRKNMLTVL